MTLEDLEHLSSLISHLSSLIAHLSSLITTPTLPQHVKEPTNVLNIVPDVKQFMYEYPQPAVTPTELPSRQYSGLLNRLRRRRRAKQLLLPSQ